MIIAIYNNNNSNNNFITFNYHKRNWTHMWVSSSSSSGEPMSDKCVRCTWEPTICIVIRKWKTKNSMKGHNSCETCLPCGFVWIC